MVFVPYNGWSQFLLRFGCSHFLWIFPDETLVSVIRYKNNFVHRLATFNKCTTLVAPRWSALMRSRLVDDYRPSTLRIFLVSIEFCGSNIVSSNIASGHCFGRRPVHWSFWSNYNEMFLTFWWRVDPHVWFVSFMRWRGVCYMCFITECVNGNIVLLFTLIYWLTVIDYMFHRWPEPCSVSRNHNPFIQSVVVPIHSVLPSSSTYFSYETMLTIFWKRNILKITLRIYFL